MLNDTQLTKLRSAPINGANRLAVAMKLLDVTQDDIETATGLTQPYISVLVNGRYSKLPLETARKLARYFGCTIEDLFPSREQVA